MGKINDFTIKPTKQHSFLVTGFSRHASSSLSSVSTIILSAMETGRTHRGATWTQLQPGKVLAQALVLQGSEPSCSDNNGGFSDSGPDSSSDDDCGSSKDGKSLCTRVNLPWDLVQEHVCWHGGKRASLGSGFLNNLKAAGLSRQYASA